MKPHAASFILGALAIGGCSAADGSSPQERTGEAQEASESLTSPSAPNAIRFLEQATFGPKPADVTHVTSVGIIQAITEQLGATPVSHYSYGYYTISQNATPTVPTCTTDTDCGASRSGLVCNTSGACVAGCRGTGGNLCPTNQICTSTTSAIGSCQQHISFDAGTQFFVHALTGTDQLRQRVAFALSQIWVVSQISFNLATTATGGTYNAPEAVYLNKLTDDAFINYRQLMYDMTVNAAMGSYLNMANNLGKDGSGNLVAPNENYARELLQLFTLGVNQLNDDGTLKMVNGAAQPTYSQDEVEALSHALTGWTYGNAANTCPRMGGTRGASDYALPMIPCDVNHDPTTQFFLGVHTGTTSALADLNTALDGIFNHPNLPPFVCKQLIQHLVTSNPSPAYVQRVVNVFKNDGSGRSQTRGNLDSVVRAILQDDEARGPVPPFAVQPSFGRLRPPALFITNMLRWLNATMVDPTTLVSNPDTPLSASAQSALNATAAVNATWSNNMGQYVPRPPTVFSYYPPGAPMPGNPNLVGPEFGIDNTGTAMARANFLNALLMTTSVGGISVDLSAAATGIPDDPTAMVQWLNTNMLHNTMSSGLESIVLDAITDPSVASTSLVKPLALYLVSISPEYQTQR